MVKSSVLLLVVLVSVLAFALWGLAAIYLYRQPITDALATGIRGVCRLIHHVAQRTRRKTRKWARRARKCFRRPVSDDSNGLELGNTSGTVRAIGWRDWEQGAFIEPASDNDSVDSSSRNHVLLSDDDSTDDSENSDVEFLGRFSYYSRRPSHRKKRVSTSEFVDLPDEPVPAQWELEYARLAHEERNPGAWVHRMVDWAVRHLQRNAETNITDDATNGITVNPADNIIDSEPSAEETRDYITQLDV